MNYDKMNFLISTNASIFFFENKSKHVNQNKIKIYSCIINIILIS